MCENSKPEISSGNFPLYFFVSEIDVGILYPNKQMDDLFVKCCPKNNDRPIVFTQPRPGAAAGQFTFTGVGSA